MKRSLFIVLGLCLGLAAKALPVYTCDFEDATERNAWALNVGNRGSLCENKWYIDAPGDYSQAGRYGLYISADGGNTCCYTATNTMYVVAMREHITIPADTFDIRFDYKGLGKGIGDSLYVCWVPAATTTNSNNATANVPTWVQDTKVVALAGAGVFTRGSGQIINDGTDHKLVLVWKSVKGRAVQPAAAVDNIEIVPISRCNQPTNITHTIGNDSKLTIKWRGTADSYDIMCYDNANRTWIVDSLLTSPQYVVATLDEGLHTIYIRSRCGDDYSDWTTYEVFYFLRGTRCIDYMDLTNTNCFTGTAGGSAKATRGKVDNGYASGESRHTLHYLPAEYDPRTENGLKTVPDGYLASVRLGNWLVGAEAEAVEYTYRVPTGGKNIFKLLYAVVMEDPHHEEPAQPRFTLDILANNKPLPGGCGAADFRAGYGDLGSWHVVGNSTSAVQWKDWTEVSINLADYEGQTLTVRLQTFDCTQSGHYGYAYFALDCDYGTLSGLNCGEDNPTTSFEAPSGFNYRWYCDEQTTALDGNTYAPDQTISTDQIFTIAPMDTLQYHVDVIQISNGQCYYTLDACGIPRFPKAIASASASQVNCQNVVEFTNNSCIFYKNQITDRVFSRQEGVDAVLWDFGDGTTSASMENVITHVYPRRGGQYDAVLHTYLSNGVCTSDTIIHLNLPDVSMPETNVHLSVGDMFEGKVYWNEYAFDKIVNDDSGCEWITHVFVHEKNFEIEDSICEGAVYVFDKRELATSGTYVANLKNTWNLDSIVTLRLKVVPRLDIAISDTMQICADEHILSIPYEVHNGDLDGIMVMMSDSAAGAGFESIYTFDKGEPIEIPMPEDAMPNYYNIEFRFITPWCPIEPKRIVFLISYPTSVLKEKDGILALYNEEYNGGYDMAEFRWYRNGEWLEGEGESYIALSPAERGAEYTVSIRRNGDTHFVPTCPVVYGGHTALEDIIFDQLWNGEGRVYNILGVSMGANTPSLQASLPRGVYMVVVGNKGVKYHAQ